MPAIFFFAAEHLYGVLVTSNFITVPKRPLKKLNALSEETCAELTATTKRRKLDTLVADYPDTYKLTGQDEVSKTYSFPKSHVSYRKPRTVSTEQRERARQMMIANNRAKKD